MLEQTGRVTPNHHLHCAKNHGPFLLCTSVVYINVGTRWTQRDGDTSDVHIPGHTHTQSNIHKIQSFSADGELCSRQENKTRASYRLASRKGRPTRWDEEVQKQSEEKKNCRGDIILEALARFSLLYSKNRKWRKNRSKQCSVQTLKQYRSRLHRV